MTTIYWLEDPKILFDKKSITELWPSDDMTYTEKMNTLSRLIIFLTLIGLILFRKLTILIIGLAILATLTYLYNRKILNGDGVEVENNKKENFTNRQPWKDNEVILEKIPTVENKNPLNNHLVGSSKGAESLIKKKKKVINNDLLIDTVRENSEVENNFEIKDDLVNNIIFDRSLIPFNKVPDYDDATLNYIIGNTGFVKDSIFKEKNENYIK